MVCPKVHAADRDACQVATSCLGPGSRIGARARSSWSRDRQVVSAGRSQSSSRATARGSSSTRRARSRRARCSPARFRRPCLCKPTSPARRTHVGWSRPRSSGSDASMSSSTTGHDQAVPFGDPRPSTRRLAADPGVNLMGPWYLSRAAVPALREVKGAIVNVGSVAGIIAAGSSLPYAVSKAALHHLTRTLAQALAPECG